MQVNDGIVYNCFSFLRMGSRFQVLKNGTLVINSAIDKDAGDYLCMAQSISGDDVQLMKVKVSMKPAKIEHKPNGKKKVLYGNDFKVDCKASGAPKPEISWGLPDGTVVNSALQADSFNGGRRIRRYTLFDNGTLYVNQVSELQSTIMVKLHDFLKKKSVVTAYIYVCFCPGWYVRGRRLHLYC